MTWNIDEDRPGYIVEWADSSECTIIAVAVNPEHQSLIAAAPELLEALKALFDDNEIPHKNGHYIRCADAIAKAEGRS